MAHQDEPRSPTQPQQVLPILERLPGWLRITFWSVWGAFTALFVALLFVLPSVLMLGLINLHDFLPTGAIAKATADRQPPTAEATADHRSPTATTLLASSPPTSSPLPASSPLASSPSPSSTPTSTETPVPPTSTPTDTPLPPTATPVPPTATPTSTPLPTATSTSTPEPTSTSTIIPTSTPTSLPPTATATRTPTRSLSTLTPTLTVIRPISTRIAAPAAAPDLPGGILTLIAPLSIGEPSTPGPINFIWEWVGDSLAPKYGFEVRVWLDQESPTGVHDAVLDNTEGRIEPIGPNRYRLKVSDIRYAKGVLGREGNYFWTVYVVQVSPGYADFGLQAIPARFRYEPFQNRRGPR